MPLDNNFNVKGAAGFIRDIPIVAGYFYPTNIGEFALSLLHECMLVYRHDKPIPLAGGNP